MSRIGKKPVSVPAGVTANVSGQLVKIKGSKGELSFEVPEEVSVALENGAIAVQPRSQTKRARALWGTSRARINNLVVGTTAGFEKKLEINGVGYEAAIEGKVLVLKLGFNRPVRFPLPTTVTIEAPTPTSLLIKGIDNQQVGSVAAAIRKLRKPDPYKGKGIKYSDEVIRRKAGKAFASGGGG